VSKNCSSHANTDPFKAEFTAWQVPKKKTKAYVKGIKISKTFTHQLFEAFNVKIVNTLPF
jgi:hypothetical protein